MGLGFFLPPTVYVRVVCYRQFSSLFSSMVSLGHWQRLGMALGRMGAFVVALYLWTT